MASADVSPRVDANPVLSSLARLIDALAGGLHALSRSRAAAIAGMVVVIAGVLALGLQETGRGDLRIYDTEPSRISASMGGRYVRVTGRLDASRPYQTRLNLGPLELRGGEWVSLVALDGRDQVWVTRDTLPAGASGVITLVGRLTLGGGQEPPVYLDAGPPPDPESRDRLAAAGGAAALGVIALAALAWLARRADFAPRLPAFAGAVRADAPAFVWFGALIPGAPEPLLRNAPVQVATTRTEARIRGKDWETAVRHARSAAPITVASRFGALPGVCLVFEDERGLTRRAVLASGSAASRDQLITALGFVGR